MTDSTSPKPDPSEEPTQSVTNVSGGVNLETQHDISVGGDVVGRDKITITEEVAYKVHGLANPYLGLQSFTYAEHAKYAGRG